MNDHPIYNTIITVYIFNDKLYLNQNITNSLCISYILWNKHYSYKNKARFPNGKRALLRPDL